MGGWVSIHRAIYPTKLGPQPFNTNEIIKRSLLDNPATKTTPLVAWKTVTSIAFKWLFCLDPCFVLRIITDTTIDMLSVNVHNWYRSTSTCFHVNSCEYTCSAVVTSFEQV